MLGRNWQTLLPVLAGGKAAIDAISASAQKNGLILGQADVDSVAKYNAAMADAKEASKGFVVQVGLLALPIKTVLMEYMAKAAQIIRIDVVPVLAKIVPVVEAVGRGLMAVFGAFQSGGFSGGMKKLGSELGDGLKTIGSLLLKGGKALWEWIQPQIVPALRELGKLLDRLGNWVVHTALPSIVSHLVTWAKAFAAWIGPALPGIIKELTKINLKIAQWIIVVALPAIAKQLGKLALGLLQALGTALKPLGLIMAKPFEAAGRAVEGAWNAVAAWFRGLPGKIKAVFSSAWQWLVNAGIGILTGLWTGVQSVWNTVSGWFGGIGGKIKGFFGGAASWLYGIGSAILSGLLNGLKAAWQSVVGFLSSLGSKIKSLKGPIEKDRLLLVKEGAAIMSGLHAGLRSGYPQVASFMAGLTAQFAGTRLSPSFGYSGHSASRSGIALGSHSTGPVVVHSHVYLDGRELNRGLGRSATHSVRSGAY